MVAWMEFALGGEGGLWAGVRCGGVISLPVRSSREGRSYSAARGSGPEI